MPLYFCKMPEGNVGDDLNEVVWNHYFNGIHIPANHYVIGIGSLLNQFIPEGDKYTVISSGVGYGDLPLIDENWTFLAVRGEITRKALNIKSDVVMIDGAYLLYDFHPKQSVNITHDVGYIPHVESLANGDWQSVCEAAGIKLIDPRLELNVFLNELCSCEKVLCEAMHGAILADIYRVPWHPVKAYHHINTKKWDDWLSPFNKTATFSKIKGIWSQPPTESFTKWLKNSVKRAIFLFSEPDSITPPYYPASSTKDRERLINQMKGLSKAHFQLNNEKDIAEKVKELKDAINHFKTSLEL